MTPPAGGVQSATAANAAALSAALRALTYKISRSKRYIACSDVVEAGVRRLRRHKAALSGKAAKTR